MQGSWTVSAYTDKDASPNPVLSDLCLNESHLNSSWSKYRWTSRQDTIQWHEILHFDLSYINKAQCCSADKHTVQQFLKKCRWVFSPPRPPPPNTFFRADQRPGDRETNSAFHFMQRERCRVFFIACSDCRAESKSLFLMTFGTVWQTAKRVIAMLGNDEVRASRPAIVG